MLAPTVWPPGVGYPGGGHWLGGRPPPSVCSPGVHTVHTVYELFVHFVFVSETQTPHIYIFGCTTLSVRRLVF